jgi:hypothetical protein
MFFHKRLLQTIGYPLDQMYLYRDDHEYSHRIVKAGLKIYLDRESVIEDMEVSWHGRKKYRFFARFMTLVDGEEMKTYFLIRNSIFFECKYFVTNQLEYSINRFDSQVIFSESTSFSAPSISILRISIPRFANFIKISSAEIACRPLELSALVSRTMKPEVPPDWLTSSVVDVCHRPALTGFIFG